MLPSGNGIGCNDVENYCAVESWMSMLALYIGIVFSALLISEIGIIVTSLDRSRQHPFDLHIHWTSMICNSTTLYCVVKLSQSSRIGTLYRYI